MTTSPSTTILVIEDDGTMREGIRTVLEREGHTVLTAASGEEGGQLFRQNHPRLVITDLRLPGQSGMELLREFLQMRKDTVVILISAYGTIDLAVQSLKEGARDFIAKPFTIDELRMKVRQVIRDLPEVIDPDENHAPAFHGMVGQSAAAWELFQTLRDVATVDSPVLITGESGTGKELAARAIHAESSRRGKPFLAVNCGALTESLLESELFGHEKGAFTGAIQQHKGVFERADTGTILLDEIGEISPRMQVKLLRVLQYQRFHRVGGNAEIHTDIRVIASTNRDLKTAIRENQFREDLYFRLNVLPIRVPALRERTEDLPLLTRHITAHKAAALNKSVPEWSPEAVRKLQQYPWPGNIRELENFLERLLIFHKKDRVAARDIYFEEPEGVPADAGGLNEVLEETEYAMILEALKKSGGVKQRAARILGIKTSTLYYKMDKYGIDADKAN